MTGKTLIDERSWEEFRDAGLLWFVNTILHVFGWALVVYVEQETDKVIKVAPVRSAWRGFAPAQSKQGYKNLAAHLRDNAAAAYEIAYGAEDERGKETKDDA